MYIAMDCETGGFGDVSLLTVSFLIYDIDFNLVDELNLKLKPKDGTYKVQAGALAVNHIDIIEHDKIAETKSTAGQKLFKFLTKHKPEDDRLTPVGHNVAGDVAWVKEHLINTEAWNQFCSYRTLDSSIIARFLKMCGLLDIERAGLANLIEHFELDKEIEGNAHEERYDAIASMKSIQKMVQIVKEK